MISRFNNAMRDTPAEENSYNRLVATSRISSFFFCNRYSEIIMLFFFLLRIKDM